MSSREGRAVPAVFSALFMTHWGDRRSEVLQWCDAASEDTLAGASVEGGEDGRWQSRPSQTLQGASSVQGPLDQGGDTLVPGEILAWSAYPEILCSTLHWQQSHWCEECYDINPALRLQSRFRTDRHPLHPTFKALLLTVTAFPFCCSVLCLSRALDDTR